MNEQELARNWRERMKLSRQELADLTGYSASAIYLLETEQRTSTAAWKRFKCVCLAVHVMRLQNPVVNIEQWKWGEP